MQWEYLLLLLLTVIFALVYSCLERRSTSLLGYCGRGSRIAWLVRFLTTSLLLVGWSVFGFPLPLFYIAAYLLRAERLLADRPLNIKNWFFLNLSYISTLAFHLVFIATASLGRGVAMRTLLVSGTWRAASVVVVLGINIIEDMVFLKWKKLSSVLAAEAGSAEARPFMAFLWFSTAYLLVDSLLCEAETEPVYAPLFLIGSCAVLMFLIVRFLTHINAIIQYHALREEHDRLEAALEAKEASAGALKRLADRDSLTGAFSRRYLMERITALIAEGSAFSVAFLDLDGLKQINDRQGHDAGDRHLIRFADALRGQLREGDVLARVGGDEFVVLMPGIGQDASARRIEAIRTVFGWSGDGKTPLRFSYGITALAAGAAGDAETLLKDADRGMYRDKELRRGAGRTIP